MAYLSFHLLQRLRDFLQLALDLDWHRGVRVGVFPFQGLHDALQQSLLGIQLDVNLLTPQRVKKFVITFDLSLMNT